MKKVQLDNETIENLVTMLGIDSPEKIPVELLNRCRRIEALIRKVKPHGALHSTQVLAIIVDSWFTTDLYCLPDD